MTDQNKEQQKPIISQPPKGVGLSSKVLMSVVVATVVLSVLVISMIFSYRGNKHEDKPQDSAMLVAEQGSITPESAINKLNKEAYYGVLAREKPITVKARFSQVETGEQQPLQNNINDQNFKKAASSGISVINNFNSSLSGQNGQGQATTPSQSGYPLAQMPAENSLSNALSNAIGTHVNYNGLNMQSEKQTFVNQNQKKDDKFYLNSKLEKPISPYEIKAGTIIPATLVTGINSDLPGQITAKVSRNVYDTVTGNYLLIPQGTTILGVYDSQVSYGQNRILMAWSRLIFPNGDSFDLEGQAGADLSGMAGMHDLVNNHYVRIFGSALAFSVFGALGQLSQPKQQTDVLTNQQIIYAAIGQEMSQAAAQMIEKNMNIQPTITIRPGAEFNVLLSRDMVLPGPYLN